MIMQNFIKIKPRVYLASNAISAVGRFGLIILPLTMYGGILFSCSPGFRDSDFVFAQYLENKLMECIRMENGI